jgi:hypothetical protein
MPHSLLSCDVLDIAVHKNVRLSEFTVSDILDSDHLPKLLLFLHHFRTRNLLDPFNKFTYWERIQILAFKLILFRIQINSEEVGDKAALYFFASIASAYQLWPSKITLSDINYDQPGLEGLLKLMRMLRKLRQVN